MVKMLLKHHGGQERKFVAVISNTMTPLYLPTFFCAAFHLGRHLTCQFADQPQNTLIQVEGSGEGDGV